MDEPMKDDVVTQELGAAVEAALAIPEGTRKRLDINRLMDAADRLLTSKIDERSRMVSDYERYRMETLDNYRIQMEQLQRATEASLRDQAIGQAKRLEVLDGIIGKLKAMREA